MTAQTTFRVRRLRDGRFYQGPMHKNVFTANGKRYLTRKGAQDTIDAYERYRAFDNGPLEIVTSIRIVENA